MTYISYTQNRHNLKVQIYERILIILHTEVDIFAGTVSGDAHYALCTENHFRIYTCSRNLSWDLEEYTFIEEYIYFKIPV